MKSKSKSKIKLAKNLILIAMLSTVGTFPVASGDFSFSPEAVPIISEGNYSSDESKDDNENLSKESYIIIDIDNISDENAPAGEEDHIINNNPVLEEGSSITEEENNSDEKGYDIITNFFAPVSEEEEKEQKEEREEKEEKEQKEEREEKEEKEQKEEREEKEEKEQKEEREEKEEKGQKEEREEKEQKLPRMSNDLMREMRQEEKIKKEAKVLDQQDVKSLEDNNNIQIANIALNPVDPFQQSINQNYNQESTQNINYNNQIQQGMDQNYNQQPMQNINYNNQFQQGMDQNYNQQPMQNMNYNNQFQQGMDQNYNQQPMQNRNYNNQSQLSLDLSNPHWVRDAAQLLINGLNDVKEIKHFMYNQIQQGMNQNCNGQQLLMWNANNQTQQGINYNQQPMQNRNANNTQGMIVVGPVPNMNANNNTPQIINVRQGQNRNTNNTPQMINVRQRQNRNTNNTQGTTNVLPVPLPVRNMNANNTQRMNNARPVQNGNTKKRKGKSIAKKPFTNSEITKLQEAIKAKVTNYHDADLILSDILRARLQDKETADERALEIAEFLCMQSDINRGVTIQKNLYNQLLKESQENKFKTTLSFLIMQQNEKIKSAK